MRAKREYDTDGQIFSRQALRYNRSSHIRSYHSGQFDDGEHPFEIYLVEKSEAQYLKKHAIPVGDITDPESQLKRLGHKFADWSGASPIGFVQATEGARLALEKGGFKQKLPSFRVVPDLLANISLQ